MPSTETRNLDTYIGDFRNEPDIAEQNEEAVMEAFQRPGRRRSREQPAAEVHLHAHDPHDRFSPEDFHLLGDFPVCISYPTYVNGPNREPTYPMGCQTV